MGNITSRTSPGLGGPPRGRAFPGEPEPPWGNLRPARGSLLWSPQVSTPSPSWETSPALLRGAAADSSLWAGADNCLSAPQQRPARAVPRPEPATQPLRPHPGADSPQTYPDSPDLAFPRVPRPRPGAGSASAGEICLVHGSGRSLRATWAHERREAAARKGVQIQRELGSPLLTLSSPPCFPPRRRRKFPSTHL